MPLLNQESKYTLSLTVNPERNLSCLKEQYPKAEVIRASLNDSEAVRQFVSGATTSFHIRTSFHPHETEITYVIIDAGVKAGIKHFVRSSVIQTQLCKLLNRKRYVEDCLFESGLDYTFLQPTHFMDGFPTPMLMKQESPIWPALYNLEIPVSMISQISLRDFADEAIKVIKVIKEREKHFFATYPLTLTPQLKQQEDFDPPRSFQKSLNQLLSSSIVLQKHPQQDFFVGA